MNLEIERCNANRIRFPLAKRYNALAKPTGKTGNPAGSIYDTYDRFSIHRTRRFAVRNGARPP